MNADLSHVAPDTVGLGQVVDAHAHVFEPLEFPYVGHRSYTPGTAPVQVLRDHQAAWGVSRTVLVQPSVYGTDNACMLSAIATIGQGQARGIAVVDLDPCEQPSIDALHAAGARGIRLNLKVAGASDATSALRMFKRAATRITRPDWCVQVHTSAAGLHAVEQALGDFKVPIVLDHFAGLGPESGTKDLDRLLELIDTGRVFVKLSAPYRVADDSPDFRALDVIARRLVERRSDRLLWGSDWPHTGGDGPRRASVDSIEPFRVVDVPATLRAIARWAGSADIARQVLISNAERLYGFDPAPVPAPAAAALTSTTELHTTP